MKFLDRVIDINFYPISAGRVTRQQPLAAGGARRDGACRTVFFALRLPFDAPEARGLSQRIQEEIYFHALAASCALAAEFGPHPAFAETRAAQGVLQFDLWGVTPEDPRAGTSSASKSGAPACAIPC